MTARMRARAAAQAGRVAIAITDLDGDGGDNCGLDAIAERLAKAHLVGLGEGTHGTAEFNRFRIGLFRRLVNRGFNHLLFEDMSWAIAPMEDYIQGRGDTNDPKVAMSRLMWPWCNREIAELLTWARDYNARCSDESRRIHLLGIDVQKPYRQARHLAELLRQGGQPQEAAEGLERIADAMPKADPLNFPELVAQQNDPATPGRWRRAHAELAAWGQRTSGALTPDEASLVDAVHCGIGLELGEDGVAARDQGMAFQILGVMSRLPKGAKAAWWAHNAHVSHNASENGFPYAGSILRDRLGETYAAIGCLSQKGTVTVKDARSLAKFENPDGTYKSGVPDVHPEPMTFIVPDDFIENVFAKRIPQGVLFMADWMADTITREFVQGRTLECAGIGATFDPSWSSEDRMPFRPEAFDALFFVKTSHASENLRFPLENTKSPSK